MRFVITFVKKREVHPVRKDTNTTNATCTQQGEGKTNKTKEENQRVEENQMAGGDASNYVNNNNADKKGREV